MAFVLFGDARLRVGMLHCDCTYPHNATQAAYTGRLSDLEVHMHTLLAPKARQRVAVRTIPPLEATLADIPGWT